MQYCGLHFGARDNARSLCGARRRVTCQGAAVAALAFAFGASIIQSASLQRLIDPGVIALAAAFPNSLELQRRAALTFKQAALRAAKDTENYKT
jgi:hypothetical protein